MKHLRHRAAFAIVIASVSSCAQPAYYDAHETLRVRAVDLDAGAGHPVIGTFVQTEYWLDFQNPTAEELDELQGDADEVAEMRPWVARDDIDISIPWTVSNLSEQDITVFVLLDGATEFYDWDPVTLYGMGGGEDADEIPFPSLLGFFPLHLEANEVRHGEFREDDLREAMYDLDVMTRYCGGPLAVLYNDHTVNPIGTEAVPDDAPLAGLVMLRMTLGSTGPATLDYAIRVRDRDGVLFDARLDDARYETMPEAYVPGGFAVVDAGEADPGVYSEFCGTAPDGSGA